MENRRRLALPGCRGRKGAGHPSARNAGPAQRRSSSCSEDDGWAGVSARVQALGAPTVRIQEYIQTFIGVPCARDLAWWGGLRRLLEVAGDRAGARTWALRRRSQIERRSSQRSGAAVWLSPPRSPITACKRCLTGRGDGAGDQAPALAPAHRRPSARGGRNHPRRPKRSIAGTTSFTNT
jgi:hypothetical protein